MGKNNISNFPSMIAKWAGLQEPEKFTGHCFRRTAASWAVESGADVLSLKLIGDWRTSTSAEGYVDQSISTKTRLSKLINPPEKKSLKRKISNDGEDGDDLFDSDEDNGLITPSKRQEKTQVQPFNIQNCSNCEFHININK